jgi:methionyl-tRNA synthetase
MYYISTPIPYTNSKPHLGHLLEAVFNDTIARFYRTKLGQQEVKLCMGLDQHGLKIYQKAQEAGQEPGIFAKEQGQTFKNLWSEFLISYDTFVETTSLRHKIVSQMVWKKLQQKGFIYKKKYTGLYSVGAEDFISSSQLTPEGLCPTDLKKPITMSEENYFFKLSHFSEQILEFLRTSEIKPEYISREQINFVEGGLNDISISREKSRLPWGIAVPGDNDQVMYVWFEALINYITGMVDSELVKEWKEAHSDSKTQVEEKIWNQIKSSSPIDLMYLSKEIAKFHLVIWIGMLLGVQLPLPKRALAHGLINDSEGKKFSKSLGNGVYPEDLVEKIGVDGTRFILLHDINVDGDTNFDWKTIEDSYNSHLANNIGNLLMRVTNLAEKYLKSGLEDRGEVEERIFSVLKDFDIELKPVDWGEVSANMEKLDTRNALEVILRAGDLGNSLLEETKPWMLIKEGRKEDALMIIQYLVYLLQDIGQYLQIMLPESGRKILETVKQVKIAKASVLFAKAELDYEKQT